jgi:hypothetical protein
MAQTGKLGTADSQLANVQLAFAAAEPSPPSVTTGSGRLGGQLGDMVLALGGVIGASVIHLAAESVLVAAQTAAGEGVFVPHASPLWALGGQDSQLGDTELAFSGADAALPTITTQSGRLGGRLGDLVPGLGGLVGAGVIHLSAESVLAIAQTADPAPTFAPHASPLWALGGQDSQLGDTELAFAGAEEARPETGDRTGQLGTLNSLLGNMRPALGEEEGGGGANIVYADAESNLSLSAEAAASVVRTCAASSALVLSDAAGRNNLLSGAAESAISLDVAADFSVARAAAAESTLVLADAAGRNNLLSGAIESAISLDAAAEFIAVRAVAAESTLALVDAAANIGGELIETAAESPLVLDVAAGFTVARAAAAESTLALVDAATRNNLLSGSAESAISLGTTADFTVARAVAAESILALAVEVARVLPAAIDVSAESAISMTGAAGRNNIVTAAATSVLDQTTAATCVHVVPTPVSAESTISLGTAAACSVARPAGAWDELWSLWHEASVVVVRKVAAESPLALAQTELTARPWYLSAESPLQTVTEEYDPERDAMVAQIEGLQDAASVARPLPLAVQQSISLGQSASVVKVKPNAINVSAESVLELLGEVRPNRTGEVGHWLAFTQTATVDKCKPARSALELAAEAAAVWTGPRDADSALNLRQSATYYLVSAGVLQRYHPFVGTGELEALAAPPSTLESPRPGITAPFQLVYPSSGPVTDSVTLRAPNFGNKDRLGFNRVLRETRGGTLIVFADPMWPKIQTLVLNFSGLTSDQAQALLTFLDAHLGEEVGVYDWEHRYWTGVITTPTDPMVQDGRASFSASFEFEGELVPA